MDGKKNYVSQHGGMVRWILFSLVRFCVMGSRKANMYRIQAHFCRQILTPGPVHIGCSRLFVDLAWSSLLLRQVFTKTMAWTAERSIRGNLTGRSRLCCTAAEI